jgi:hypothetical protein
MTTDGTKIEDYAFLSDTQTGALVSAAAILGNEMFRPWTD